MTTELTLEELRRLIRRLDEMRRTVVCSPALVPRVQALVDAWVMGGLITVRADEHCPPDKVFIFTDPGLTLDTTTKTPPTPSPGEPRRR